MSSEEIYANHFCKLAPLGESICIKTGNHCPFCGQLITEDVQIANHPDRIRNGSPTFYELLNECAEIHDRKSHDYANNDDPYGNYRFAGLLANLFSHSPDDAGFVGRIGEKIYRLANLGKDNKIPLNESIEDTERDIVTITALWMAARRDLRSVKDHP